MKITNFLVGDLARFIPNEFSNPDMVLDELADPTAHVWTVWGDNGFVRAIVWGRPYWGNNWSGFTLCCKDFNAADGEVVKELTHAIIKDRNIERLETESVACDKLRRWHEHVGFKLEGTRIKRLFGKDYDMWALMPKEA